MNTIKNILVIGVLLAVGYAVYTTLNTQSEPPQPSDQSDGWPPSAEVRSSAKSDSTPAKTDAKVSGFKNPFSFGGTGSGERVIARESSSLGPSRPGATTRPQPSGIPERSPSSSPRSDTGSTGAAHVASGRPEPSPQPPAASTSAPSPGLAVSTDLPVPPGPMPAQTETGARTADPPKNSSNEVRKEFADLLEDAHRRLAQGAFAEVHLALSRLYGNADLTGEESRQLTELLDQLAGTVIYSRQHLLEPPYVVRPGDTLPQIAQNYNVPWQLLAKINGVRDPNRLEPGRQLKVVRGPFEAVVFLDRYELVLMVGGRYAGRFPIGIGQDLPTVEGEYTVRKKLADPPSLGQDRPGQPRDSLAQLGKFWIELDERIGIHGTQDIKNLRRSGGPGAICLGPRDIEDVYDILSAASEGSSASKVTIRR